MIGTPYVFMLLSQANTHLHTSHTSIIPLFKYGGFHHHRWLGTSETSCRWVSSFRRFEQAQFIYLEGARSQKKFSLTLWSLKGRTPHYFRKSRANNPAKQRHIPEGLNTLKHRLQNFKFGIDQTSSPLKWRLTRSSETSVNSYQTARSQVLEHSFCSPTLFSFPRPEARKLSIPSAAIC